MKESKKGAAVPMVRRRDAALVCFVLLLAGFFLGWQGALLAVNQEAAQARQGAGAGEPAASQQTGSAAMGPMNQMMGQAKALEEKAAKTPGDYEVWVALGNLYFDTDMHQKSIEAYEKALAIKADLPDVWVDMGVMYKAVHKPGDAIRCFDKALGYNPGHEVALLNKGVVYLFDLQDKPAALKAFRDLLAANPAAKTPDGKKVADMVAELAAQPAK